jgi:undecaprenyl-diphosphatase
LNLKFGLGKARAFWILLVGLTLWKVYLAGTLDIIQDEGYYYYWALFPQLSYFDHPPLTAWSMALARQLFGDTIWSVRFWPLAAGFVFPVIGRALAREIFSDEVSNRAGILLMLCPVFAGNGLLMTPDTLFALFWSLALLATCKALQETKWNASWWLLAGLWAGLGGLSKYNMVLYYFGLGILLLTIPAKRSHIFAGGLLSGIIALIIVSPVVIWNYQHDWLSFRFQLQHGFSAEDIEPWVTFPEYLGTLLLLATPLLGVLAIWSSARSMVSKEPGRRFLAVYFWAVAAFFGYVAIKSKVEANWAMLAFFPGIILVAADWLGYGKNLRRVTAGLLVSVILAGFIYLSIPKDVPLSIGGHSLDIGRVEEFYGAQDVAAAVLKKSKAIQVDFICIDRHARFGAIAFYAPELRPKLWLPKQGARRFPWIDDRRWQGKTALLVSNKPRAWPWFQTVEPLGKIEIPFKQHMKRTIYFNRGIGYQPVDR